MLRGPFPCCAFSLKEVLHIRVLTGSQHFFFDFLIFDYLTHDYLTFDYLIS